MNKVILRALETRLRMCHPINSDIGKNGVFAVKQNIKRNSSTSVSRKTFAKDGEQSSICLLQIYSHKSVTSLKATRITFNAIHLIMSLFVKLVRRKVISSGITVVGYLPASFEYLLQSCSAKVSNTWLQIQTCQETSLSGSARTNRTWKVRFQFLLA